MLSVWKPNEFVWLSKKEIRAEGLGFKGLRFRVPVILSAGLLTVES